MGVEGVEGRFRLEQWRVGMEGERRRGRRQGRA